MSKFSYQAKRKKMYKARSYALLARACELEQIRRSIIKMNKELALPCLCHRDSLLYRWSAGRWHYEIHDNPNGPYLREVWEGEGTPIHPAVDPQTSHILHLISEYNDE